MGLRVDDVPKPWRAPAALLLFVAAVAAATLSVRGWVTASAAETAATTAEATVKETWAKELRAEAITAAKEAATEAARDAAVEAARSAVREVVAQVAQDLALHKAVQDEREKVTNDRLQSLERRTSTARRD